MSVHVYNQAIHFKSKRLIERIFWENGKRFMNAL